jgi:hypothetical protein
MWQRLRLELLVIVTYPLNLVTGIVGAAMLLGVAAPAVTSLVVAVAVGSVYEFVCRRAGRRVLWPFDTPGARQFRDTQIHLAELRAGRMSRRRELEQARADGRRLDALLAATRDGRVQRSEAVTYDVRVDAAERVGDRIHVTLRGGPGGHVDLFIDGERHRVVLSTNDEPYDDPVNEARRQQLIAERDDALVWRYSLPGTADAALFVDDLADGGGTLWYVVEPGVGVRIELADSDRRRVFGLERH